MGKKIELSDLEKDELADVLADVLDEWCGKLDAALERLSSAAKAKLAEDMGLPLAALLDDESGQPDNRSTGGQDDVAAIDLATLPPKGSC